MADHPKDRPDGLLVLEGGSGRVWRCLVEAKIGRNELEVEQVERYLAIAGAVRLDAVLTISNQFVALPSPSPLSLPKSATKGVELSHWSRSEERCVGTECGSTCRARGAGEQ